MTKDNQSEEVVLPDGTEVTVSIEDDNATITYVVDEGQGNPDVVRYNAEQARTQAQTIREREAASWDTIFPEEAGPVLDVASALEKAADHVEG